MAWYTPAEVRDHLVTEGPIGAVAAQSNSIGCRAQDGQQLLRACTWFAFPMVLVLAVPTRAQEPEEKSGILYLVPQRPLEPDPLRISNNNLFHAMFGFLPMESARVPEEWRLDVGIFTDISSGKLSITESPGFLFRYDATLLEVNLDSRLSIPGGWQAMLGLDLSDLLEESQQDILLTHSSRGTFIPASTRSTGVGDLRLGLKKSLFRFGPEDRQGTLGAAIGAKIPISTDKDDLLTSDGFDFALSALYTQEFAPVSIHVNVGALFPEDARVFAQKVETQIAFTAGLAVVYPFNEWGALIAQFQMNQSVFNDSANSLGILDDTVGTLSSGVRFRVGSYFLELSGGTGINDQSSDLVITVAFWVPVSL